MNSSIKIIIRVIQASAVAAVMTAAPPGAQGEPTRDFNLLPYPKEITKLSGTLYLGPANYIITHPSDTTAAACDSLSRYLPTSGAQVTVRLGSTEEGYDSSWLTADENAFLGNTTTSDEANIVKVGAEGVTVVGKGKWGMFYGVQTVNQLIRGTTSAEGIWQMNTSLPYLLIKDWPDMSWRCLSPSMTWYSGYNRLEGYDLNNWTLDEWKWLVDWSALHKCNGWAMCIYGYWPFTLPGYSETTLDVDSYFYNPATGRKEPWRFVHKNIRAEFIPELIRYANARGVRVYAYIGKNTFNGTYGLKHPQADCGGAAELLPFAPGVHEYWDAFIRRCLELGFNGFVFEDPESYHVPNQNQQCYDTFWAPWAAKYGYSNVSQTDQYNPPLGVHVEYYTWLFRQFDQMIQQHALEFGVDPEMYLISHVLLSRIMAESASDAERAQWFSLVDQKHGKPVKFVVGEWSEDKYVSQFGGDRIASLGGRGGSCTCAMRRIASVNNNSGGFSADLAYERNCQRNIYRAGGFGAMGYIFEWTNTEVFGYIAAQHLWRNAGVPGVVEDQVGFLDYSYRMHYGDEVGHLVARSMDEGPCVNDAMVMEGVFGSQWPATGKVLHRDYQYLAALSRHGLDLATQAYRLYTGQEPDLYHPVYQQDTFQWNGFDQQGNRAFNAERLRLLCVSNKRSQWMCEAALAHRKAVLLKARGAPSSEVLAEFDRAIAAAKENQLLYQINYDDDYDWTDGLAYKVTDTIQAQRDQYAASGTFADPAPVLHIPWEEQSDIVPQSRTAQSPGIYLVTDVGLDTDPDFYCLGVVFTIQVEQDDGTWTTVFRRGVNRREVNWDHWEVPLDAVLGSSPVARFRFLTDSYSRAQDRSAPSWKWALWHSPQLVQVKSDNTRTVLYDFTEHLDDAYRFVRLDSDGLDRPFEGSDTDSTGAVFKANNIRLFTPLKEGEGSGWQWVEGYDSAYSPQAPHSSQYPCFLGSTASWWAYGSENAEVAWHTAPAPESRETAALFVAGTDYSVGHAELWCNNQKLLTFDTGRTSDAAWQGSGAELRFIFGGDTRSETTPYGLSGYFVLRLPASMVAAGQPLSIKVKMLPGGGWFMLHGFRSLMQAKSGIAAFTPHIGSAFGVTGADYDVDVLMDLQGQAMVSGRTTNAPATPWANTPIQGATVEVLDSSVSTTTRSNGDYHLVVAPGTHTIRVSKSGYEASQFTLTVGPDERVTHNVQLNLAGGVVTGRVRTGGSPVAGATVRIVEGSQTATSAQDGSYTLLVPEGSWTIEAASPGFRTQQTDVTVVSNGLATRDFDLTTPNPAWDLVRDFSGISNPNGAWAYGGGAGTSFVPYTYPVTWVGAAGVSPGDVDGWDRAGGNSLAVGDGYPCWVRNKTGADFTNTWGCLMAVDRLFCYPWYGIPGKVRWTAPAAGKYTISASFLSTQMGTPATAGVAVYSASHSFDWSSPLEGAQAIESMSAQGVQLAAGESFYFEINGGTDGGVTGDSAGLKATIQQELTLNGKALLSGRAIHSSVSPSPGSPVAGVTLRVAGATTSTTTASDGSYSLLLSPGSYVIEANKIGYATRQFAVTLTADGTLGRDVEMSPLNPTWDALADFSGTSNPNGPWQYGLMSDGLFARLPSAVDWQYGAFAPPGSAEGWDRGGNSMTVVPGGYPCIVRNKTGSDIMLFGGALVFPGDRLFMSPFNGIPAAVKWTAPIEGDYSIEASFETCEVAGANGGVAVYSTSGSVSWSSALVGQGTVRRMRANGVHLARGESVYFESNDGGDGSCSGDEAGLLATIQLVKAADTLSELGRFADTTLVALRSAKTATVASGTFADRSIFLEETDRLSAIRVIPRTGLPAVVVGDSVSLTGFMRTSSAGERYVDAVAFDGIAPGPTLRPVGMGTAGFLSGAALGRVGLLVRIWGKVTYVGPSGIYAYVGDGGAISDPTSQLGARVVLNATSLPLTQAVSVGDYVAVTGVVVPVKVGNVLLPALRPRGDYDMQIW